MLKLQIKKENYKIDLGSGVVVEVRPLTSAVFFEAQSYMRQKLQKIGSDYKDRKDMGVSVEGMPDLEDENVRVALSEEYMVTGLAIAGIVSWEGILEADKDEVALLTPEKIEELMSNFWTIAHKFGAEYNGSRELLDAEKNVSSPAPNGTLAGEQDTVGGATKTTPSVCEAKKA